MDWQEVDYFPHKSGSQTALQKTFLFKDFNTALDFVNKVAVVAHDLNHHPDINLSWGRVIVSTTSHDEHKLTQRDYNFAKKINQIKS